jgi:hypothetical protein
MVQGRVFSSGTFNFFLSRALPIFELENISPVLLFLYEPVSTAMNLW